jgi:hypothetical protein
MENTHSCHEPKAENAHQHHGAPGAGPWRLAAQSTLHCLTGCVVGEVIGLAIGVELGLSGAATIALATTLAYISGFALGLWPVMRQRGLSFGAAFKLIWVGEAVSIGVMEVVMNGVDYSMGGMAAASFFSWQSIRALMIAVPAGFLAAWPVNYWLLSRDLKACH